MRAWSLKLFTFLLVAAPLTFGQVGNGTITGTVTDPAGAVVAGAMVQAKNGATGVTYTAASSGAGVYTITDLPVGTYAISTTVSGFKTYTHTNLAIAATQVVKADIKLEVGTAAESVTVTAEASLLKTETGDLAHNITITQMDDLPLLGIGTANAGTSGYRNPYNTLLTLPGVSSYASSGQFTLNGLGGNMTETMRVEGQDSTSRLFGNYQYTQMAQPSADSIQEIAYQTSNYAPEFGQAGSVVINMTMKSGTNQYHGSAYDYFVNEDLNSGYPYTVNTSGVGKVRPINRRNDFGGTLGGPIYIPKIYNGHNRSFFFFSYEQYLENSAYSFSDTVPVPAYLKGDFSAISPNGNCSLCSELGIQTGALGTPTVQLDPLGNKMFANEIYDPRTRGVTAGGLGFAMPFEGNVIPSTRFDPVAIKLMALFPAAQNSNLTGNYDGGIGGNRYSAIPSIKIDHIIDTNDKLSFYWDRNNTESQISSPLGNADGLPEEIGAYRGTFIPTWTSRLNYDRTMTPTLLLHLGIGYQHTSFADRAPFLKFDPSAFGLTGFLINRQFPSFVGLCAQPVGFGATGCAGPLGGMQNVGTSGQIQTQNYEEKPSFTGNVTWVRGKHTFKAGAELYLEQAYNGSFAGVTLTTATDPTEEPFTPTVSLGGYTTGFGFASFLLGDYTSTRQTPQENYRQGSQQWGLFVQDSWKVTPKLTVDYGLRYDLATPQREQYGRLGQIDATAANANAGGRLGAVRYASTCNCSFYKSAYPYGIGPRLGVAYQLDSKTVLRGGWGVVYQFVAYPAGAIVGTNGIYPLAGINPFVNIQTPGAIVQPAWPVTDPNIYPNVGTVSPTPFVPDANENRPPRVNQFSIGFQREITNNFVIEASYVANRGVWEHGTSFFTAGGPLGFLSQTSPQLYAQYGLFPYPGTGPCGTGGGVCASTSYDNDGDRALLTQPINSSKVTQAMAARGFSNLFPYASFPATNSLQSTLYPYPQFGNLGVSDSPTGNSKYDSLQVKATKRFSHGLQAGGTFTWAQGFVRATRQDFFNPASSAWDLQNIPLREVNFNFIYTVPKASFLPKFANAILSDWQIGGYANYQSGAFLTPPTSVTNANFLSSEEVRVPNQPLYNVDINNIHSYSPYYTQVLNPNAWQDCPKNSTCTAPGTLYKDFRGPRTPTENANFGRNFRLGKEGRYNLYIRAEFVNIFNRTLLPAPSSTSNPRIKPSKNPAGIYNGGFGVINTYFAPGSYASTPGQATAFALQPRTGTIVARFSF